MTDGVGAAAAVRLSGLHHSFAGTPPVAALNGIDLVVAPGEFVSIVGPSGCGKSTILRVLAGLLAPTAGQCEVASRSTVSTPGLVAYMPQRDSLLPWRRTLGNATLGAELAGVAVGEARAEALALFDRFGLAGFETAWPSQLSGGMRQRLALLRTFLARRDVLVLDEPFGALDALTRRTLQRWLADVLATLTRTCLLVTHDVDEALWLSDRVIVLSHRPASVVRTVAVTQPRPRHASFVTDPDFMVLKATVLQALEDTAPEDTAPEDTAEPPKDTLC